VEHSYKADSSLSAAGEVYAERLKDFVLTRREEIMREREASGNIPQGPPGKLNVSAIPFPRCI
jgi:hypothetical protein